MQAEIKSEGGQPTTTPPDYSASQAAYPPGQPGYPAQQAAYPPGQAGYPAQQVVYPAGQPGYHPGQPVVVTQPPQIVTTVVHANFGDAPVNIKCPNCKNQVNTIVTHDPGSQAWLFCIIMCVLGFWICAFIPFCVDSMQNVYHDCPVCRYRLSTLNR